MTLHVTVNSNQTMQNYKENKTCFIPGNTIIKYKHEVKNVPPIQNRSFFQKGAKRILKEWTLISKYIPLKNSLITFNIYQSFES